MNAELFQATINQYRERKPFKPFTVVLANGDRFEVDMPTAVGFRDGVGGYLGPGHAIKVFACHEVSHISEAGDPPA